jgi:Ion channel
MLTKVLFAGGLVVVTVFIHGVGISALLRAMLRLHALEKSGFWRIYPLLIAVTCWLISIHSVAICVWGLFYFWQGCLPDAESSFYFSGVTYTTVGYGELVLPQPWRLLAPLEALTGTLMFGVSTGLFFAIVLRWITNWTQGRPAPEPRPAAPTKP